MKYPPGKSPFHIKGVAYEGTRGQYDKLVPGGFAAVLKALPNGTLASFASQDFFASNWYDVLPMFAMDSVAVTLIPCSLDKFLHDAAIYQASVDAQGIYRVALRVASPAVRLLPMQFFKRMVGFSHQYFNFGQSKAKEVSAREVEVTTEGVPLVLADWFQRSAAHYISALLKMSGLDAIQVTFLPIVPLASDANGEPMARATWRAKW